MTDTDADILALPVVGSRPTLEDSVDLRDLIPNAEHVKNPIRYSDDVWNFAGFPFVNQTNYRLDFGGVPPRWRNVVKDWTLLRLNPKLALSGKSGLDMDDVMAQAAAEEDPLKLPSLFAYVLGLTKSLKIIDQYAADTLGPEDWSSFAYRLAQENPNAQAVTLASYARPVLSLWMYRGVLRRPNMFGGRPLAGRTPETVFGVPRRDLNVERPAPELCGPLLGLSLWIIDHCAEDILLRLETLAAVPDMTQRAREEQLEILEQRLLSWEQTGRPLPGVTNLRRKSLSPAWATFVKLSGCSSTALRNPTGGAKKILDRLHKELGVSESEDGFDLPLSTVHGTDGGLHTWTEGLPPTRYGLGLDYWAASLAYSCAMVIAILTTVRERELAALPHDCLVEGTYERGDVDVSVTRMHGFLVKNRTVPTPAKWIVGEDVIKAVKIIQRLKSALQLKPRKHPETGKEILLHPGLGRAQGEQSADSLQLSAKYLVKFKLSSEYLADRGLIAPLPQLPKWLAHRTLRITGIEAYASQAWGDALAAAQAHWSNRKVAEGYFGHLPRSVYIADPESVEEVRQMATAQALLDVAHDATNGESTVAGNGSARLEAVLSKANARQLVTGPVAGRDLLKIAKSNQNVFVGEFTICVFGPGGMCGNEDQADFKLCRPFVCRNSATTRAQRARLELRRRSWHGHTGVFQRARLKIEADVPGLVREFADIDDTALRSLILADLPGRAACHMEPDADND